MAEQLGKIEKPEAKEFTSKKKLYLVPLLFSGKNAPEDYADKYRRYWQQVGEQVANLEEKLGKAGHIYHESVYEAGQNGLNVRVNSVHPGVIDTAMTRDLFGDPDDAGQEERWGRLAQMAPLGRVGAASDVANVILFLASDASAFCTGAEFVVDGGVTAT